MADDLTLDGLRSEVARLQSENAQLRAQSADPDHRRGAGRFETQVDLAGLMRVVSDHLYSSPTVAVRELVQNAHDSIVRRRRVDPAWTGGTVRVEVLDGDRLCISDDGIGMTEADVHDFLATVGRGETGTLRRAGAGDDLIGQFGLGFLSAFVLGSQVEVISVAELNPTTAVRYRSTDGLTYSLTSESSSWVGGQRQPVGTTVTISLRDGGRDLADPHRLRRVLSRYCCLLRVPVFVDGTRINLVAPWHAAPPGEGLTPLQFAAHFERGMEPIAVIPLGTGEGTGTDLTGMLWVQSYGSYATSDNRNLSVFVRGMLLDADARDLLPRWAGFIGGVVESKELAPTASREDIQRNREFDLAADAIADAVRSGLAALASDLPGVWHEVVHRHNDALVGAAVSDDAMFELVADQLTIATSAGQLRAADLAMASNGRIYVGDARRNDFSTLIHHTLGVPIAHGHRFGVLNFLQLWSRRNGVELVELGTQDADALFRPVQLTPDELMVLHRTLADPGERLVPARFEPAALPFVMMTDLEADLRERVESDAAEEQIPAAALALARAFTSEFEDRPKVRVYVNLSCPAVASLLATRAAETGETARALGERLKALKIVLNPAASSRSGASGRSSLDWALETLSADPIHDEES